MTFLAEYAMRGRMQALLISLATASLLFTCWISAAVIALVTLRLGISQGFWLLMWALLPSGSIAVVFGDLQPVLIIAGTTVLAAVLRVTVSMQLTVLLSAAIGLVTGGLFLVLAGEQLQQLALMLANMLEQMEQQLNAGGGAPVDLVPPTIAQLAGVMGLGTAVVCVLCLLLGRHWQSHLYHPGGFGEEFRGLYLPPHWMLLLVGGAAALILLAPQHRFWAGILVVPLVFAGFALVHAYARWRNKTGAWLLLFYGMWLLLDPMKWLVLAVACTDSVVNFRARWMKVETKGEQQPPAERKDDDFDNGA